MWPKCCPSFKSATWDQDHFTHPYFVSGFRPALLAFKGWPTERIPPIFFSSKTSFVRVLLLGQLLFPHASRHEWGISGTWGGAWIFMKGRDAFKLGERFLSLRVSLPLLRRTHGPVTKSCTHKKCKDLFHTSEHILISRLTALIQIKSACSLHTTEHTHTHTQRLAFAQLIQLDFPP